jgi:hypothetical protein
MLRDSRAGFSHPCLENPRPTRAELSLTEDATSPFQAEPRQPQLEILKKVITIVKGKVWSPP